jgi:acyl transferase domain-containing protein/aryl carrier-like protein
MQWFRGQLSSVLELPEHELGADTPFDEFGLDSILLMSLLGAMDRALGVPLQPATLLEQGTVRAFARLLCEQHPAAITRALVGASPHDEPPHAAPAALPPRDAPADEPPHAAPAPSAPPPADDPRPRSLPIAVIAAACHFPGAPDLQKFWDDLHAGRHAIRDVPPDRWDVARFYAPVHARGRTISRWGGFLEGIDRFDPAYFGIGEAEAVDFDPLVRQFLEVGAEAVAHAGYEPAELAGGRVGVYAGARVANFSDLVTLPDKHSIVGLGQNFIAAHLAQHFDLRGPNLVIDSACSSSLVAVHQACRALQAGDIDLAFAGGVDLLLDEQPYLILSESRALSPDGRCFTFDRRANGFVPGEGCGVVLLKRLADALADGDRVLAVIEGSAVNNDGRTMGITTPNPDAQAAVVRDAQRDADAAPDSVTLIEAHGTGTMIGDPIELRALTDVFRAATDAVGFCGVGSVKTNLGHLASAAGIAGLIKIVLCLQHRWQAPTLHCTQPNPRFDFAASPFTVLTAGRPWTPRHGLRRAGVSAFGFGGTNAHVVLREAPEHTPRRSERPPPAFRRRRLWPAPARRPLLKLEFPR